MEILRSNLFLLGGTTSTPGSRSGPSLPQGANCELQFDPDVKTWRSFSASRNPTSGGATWSHKRWLLTHGGFSAAQTGPTSLRGYEISSESWSVRTASLLGKVCFPAGGGLAGAGYVSGGSSTAGSTHGTTCVSVTHNKYVFNTNLWTLLTNTPASVGGGTGATTASRYNVFGGLNGAADPSTGVRNTWWGYSPNNGAWSTHPTLASSFAYATAVGWNIPKSGTLDKGSPNGTAYNWNECRVQLTGGLFTSGSWVYVPQSMHYELNTRTSVATTRTSPDDPNWGAGLAVAMTGSYLIGGSVVSNATLNISARCNRWEGVGSTWESVTNLPLSVSFPQFVSGEAPLVLGGGSKPRFALGTTNILNEDPGFESGADGWEVIGGTGVVAQTFDTTAPDGNYSLFVCDQRSDGVLEVAKSVTLPRAVPGGLLYFSTWARTTADCETQLLVTLEHDGGQFGKYTFQLTEQWRQCNICHRVPTSHSSDGWRIILCPDPAGLTYSTVATTVLLDCMELYGATNWIDLPLPTRWNQSFNPNVRSRQTRLGGSTTEVQNGFLFETSMEWPYLSAEQLRRLQHFVQSPVSIFHPNPVDNPQGWWTTVRNVSPVLRAYPMDVFVGHVQSLELEGLTVIPFLPDSET